MASDKRDAFVRTAERLFDAEGFHATGIERLVVEAGSGRRTLYKHFPSKHALVREVLRTRHARFTAHLDAATAAARAGGVTLALVDAHGRWNARHGARGCFMLRAMGEFAAHDDGVRRLAAETKHALLARIEAALRADGVDDPAALARRVFLVLEGGNAAAAVLGAAAAAAEARAAIAALLETAIPAPA